MIAQLSFPGVVRAKEKHVIQAEQEYDRLASELAYEISQMSVWNLDTSMTAIFEMEKESQILEAGAAAVKAFASALPSMLVDRKPRSFDVMCDEMSSDIVLALSMNEVRDVVRRLSEKHVGFEFVMSELETTTNATISSEETTEMCAVVGKVYTQYNRDLIARVRHAEQEVENNFWSQQNLVEIIKKHPTIVANLMPSDPDFDSF